MIIIDGITQAPVGKETPLSDLFEHERYLASISSAYLPEGVFQLLDRIEAAVTKHIEGLKAEEKIDSEERIDEVVSTKPSTWREEAEDYERHKELHDKIADTELRLERCKDASNGKDLLITKLETKIVKLEERLEKQSFCIICGQTINKYGEEK